MLWALQKALFDHLKKVSFLQILEKGSKGIASYFRSIFHASTAN